MLLRMPGQDEPDAFLVHEMQHLHNVLRLGEQDRSLTPVQEGHVSGACPRQGTSGHSLVCRPRGGAWRRGACLRPHHVMQDLHHELPGSGGCRSRHLSPAEYVTVVLAPQRGPTRQSCPG